MVQKPHRERRFINCNSTRTRKASCSSCMTPPWAFVCSQLDLSSLLFINLSSVYWLVTKTPIGQHSFTQCGEKLFKEWGNISTKRKIKPDIKGTWRERSILGCGAASHKVIAYSLHWKDVLTSLFDLYKSL